MTGLFHTMNIGAESLYTSRQGVDTTGHNIANAQVEGYSRQRVNVDQRDPTEARGVIIGNGVYTGSITRLHDQFIENQLNKAHQESGANKARYEGLSSIENIFNPELSDTVEDEITNFFNALQDLSNFPEELTTRTHVREMAENVVRAFNRVDSSLRQAQQGCNESLSGEVTAINEDLSQIAKLNIRIGELEAGSLSQANDLRDERDKLLSDLSQRFDVSYYEGKAGSIVVRGPKQTSLVENGDCAKIELELNTDGDVMRPDVSILDFERRSKRIVTDGLEGGKVKGLIDIRDTIVPGLLDKNNEMAGALVESFNGLHRRGFGIGGFSQSQGRNFFEIDGDLNQVAQNMKVSDVIMESTDAISVASTPLAPGDNVIANQLIQLKDMPMLGRRNVSFRDYYSDFVGDLGLQCIRARHQTEADGVLLKDLVARREAIAGVSLDEEATNLMKWQSCFTASSKVITTVDEMMDTILSLKR